LGLWSSLPKKQRLGPKLAGGWAKGPQHPKKWDPYLFLQPLKLATSNLVYNLGLGSSLPRNNLYDQNWRGSWLWEHPKNWDPLLISATSNLVHNFGFGSTLQ